MENENQKDLQEDISSDADQEIEIEETADSSEEPILEQEENVEVTSETEPAEESKADKKAFKKKLKADKKQDAMKEKVDELEDKVRRQMAEFENFRKRTEREKTTMFETGAKSVIEKMLPVVDNFERGLAAIPEADKGTPFAEGMEMIYKQMMQEFEKMDVKVIPAIGEEFNPDFHNAVMHVEDETVGENIIVEEFQKGYMYKDSVIRHSMVKVAN